MRENPWVAVKRGGSVQERKRDVARAHELLLAHSPEISALTDSPVRQHMRSVVLDSWLRSVPNVDPHRLPEQPLPATEQLLQLRRAHPLYTLLPVLRRVLIDAAEDAGLVVAVGDRSGRLLWVEGDRALRDTAANMGFVAGADWSEERVGTSAPGTAIAVNHGVQVLGAEHFNRHVHQWSCSAAPVHDPSTGALIGVLDITGGDEAIAPQTLPLLQAAVAVLESELRLNALRSTLGQPPSPGGSAGSRADGRANRLTSKLQVLGSGTHRLLSGRGEMCPLTLRHAEILTLLASHPHGIGSARLTELIYGDSSAGGTLRAELARMRQHLRQGGAHDLTLRSKPYRLSHGLEIDALRVLELARRGAHRQALTIASTGPLLPESTAPGIEELRAEIEGTLREAILGDGAPDVLEAYALSDYAKDDQQVWEQLLRLLPARSPKRAHVIARLEMLTAEAA